MNLHGIVNEVIHNQGIKSKIVVFIFRMSTYYSRKNILYKVLGLPFYILNKMVNEMFFCVEIPYKTKIASGLKIYHPHSIVLNENVVIGNNCILRQGVTIGNVILKNGEESESPVIGNDVEFGANAIVLGNISVGSKSRVGAGSVVTKSIPEFTTVVGYGFRKLN